MFGLIGTVVTGIFGMNLFGFPEMPLVVQLVLFGAIFVGVTWLLFYTLAKSKRLADFLDAISDERLPARAKLDSLLDVWRERRPRR